MSAERDQRLIKENEEQGSSLEPLLSPESKPKGQKKIRPSDLEIEIQDEPASSEQTKPRVMKASKMAKLEESDDSDETEPERRSNSEHEPAPRRQFEVNTQFDEQRLDRKFMSNKVSTTRYTCLNFLPKNLFEQFSKMANFYFTFLALLQLVPGLGTLYGAVVTFLPVIFVAFLSMIKDGFEDNKRKKQDNEENRAIGECAPRGSRAFIDSKSLDIQVGCLVKVKQNQFFPCDMIMLTSSLPKGIAYVETKNLDGETNLKHKQSEKRVQDLSKSDDEIFNNLSGVQIDCEGPNEHLYKFDGTMLLQDKSLVAIGPDQILLRGSCLRNTEWIIGICTYSGHETKIMMNSSKARTKTSKIQRATNMYILITMLIQLVLSTVAAVSTSLWTYFRRDKYWYIYPPEVEKDVVALPLLMLQSLGVWFIALMNFVPVALLVTLEFINFGQAYFIANDIDICDKKRGLQASVQSSNLNEELGMVHYIFSDKTGTLTQNVMEFKRFSAGSYEYGVDEPNKIQYPPGVTNVNFEDAEFNEHISDPSHENNQTLKRLLQALGLCHTVIADQKQDKAGQPFIAYNASSPDELALVNGARHLGFFFEERDEDNFMVCETWDGVRKFQLLNLIEFDSARKRMTVIVRTPENRILVICKGADSIIEKRLRPGQQILETTQGFLDTYAKQGLRTLLIASKELTEAEYKPWAARYQKAATSVNKEKAINALAEELEVDFELLGSTAIEDKLQDEVGKTIYDIKAAGIQLWVLTGDKIETAINIGYSCQLLHHDMNMFMLQEIKPTKVRIEIIEALGQQKVTKQARDNAVVVAGETLATIQDDEDLVKEFIDLCEGANVVLACRVSPKQKAEIVNMMRARHEDKTTLAIGDGANDVNMITAAHLGVGISGLEGQQAARASDYSIGQFKFLRYLLFYHGREAYRRNSYTIGYMFYKNILETTPIYMFGFISLFSGQPIYDAIMYATFNTFYTSLPILFFATFDYEYPKEILAKRPRLYRIGLEDLHFNKWVFWRWAFYGLWQSTLILFLAYFALDHRSPNDEGKYTGIWVSSNLVFCMLVIVSNMKILISSYRISWPIIFLTVASTGVYFVIYTLQSLTTPITEQYGTLFMMADAAQTYFVLMLFTFMFVLVDTGLSNANTYINKWYLKAIQKAKVMQQHKDAKSKSVIKRKVTSFKSRGFAFSQAPGQDKLVTDKLSDRVGVALIRQIQNRALILTFEQANEAEEKDSQEFLINSKTSSGILGSIMGGSSLVGKSSSSSLVDSEHQTKLPEPMESSGKIDNYKIAATSLVEDHISKVDEASNSEEEASIVKDSRESQAQYKLL